MIKLLKTGLTIFALAFAISCGGIDSSERVSTDEISASSGGEAQNTEPGQHGYCCNTGTGNVSKTQETGCDASDETWNADLADCLMTVCGRNCYIN